MFVAGGEKLTVLPSPATEHSGNTPGTSWGYKLEKVP
jgi:hypothetical protein